MSIEPLIYDDSDLPDGWREPDWNEGGKVHNWRTYIPEALQRRWLSLSEETRTVAAAMAQEQAGREEWD